MNSDTGADAEEPFARRIAVLAGALGQGNLGDEALAAAFEEFHAARYERVIRVQHGPSDGVTRLPMPNLALGLRKWRGAVERSQLSEKLLELAAGASIDYVWVGGLFGEPMHVRGRARELAWVRSFAARLIYYFGDAEDKILQQSTTTELIRELNRTRAWIGVRSEQAAELLRKAGLRHSVHVGIDPVFASRLRRTDATLPRVGQNSGRIALCPAASAAGVNITGLWLAAAEGAASRGWAIDWLPFHPAVDLSVCEMLSAEVARTYPRLPQHILGLDEVIPRLEAASLCVSARYHGLIFAITAGVPTIGIAWNGKIRRLLHLLGQAELQVSLDSRSGELVRIISSDQLINREIDSSVVGKLREQHDLAEADLLKFQQESLPSKHATDFSLGRHEAAEQSFEISRSVQSILTFATASTFTVVSTLIGLIATPHLLRWLGTEKFGAFRALSEWMGYLSLLELGLTGASMTVLAKAVAEGPGAAASATRVCVRAFSRVAVGMFVGGLIICAAAPALVPVSDSIRGDLRWAALILAMGTLLVPFNPFRLLLESAQQGCIVNLLLVVNSVVLTSLALVFAYQGGGVTGQAGATVLAAVAFSTAIGMLAWRQWLRLHRSSDRARTWSELLWKSNWQTIVLDISGRMAVMSDNIIIGLILGPAAVTPFVLTQRLIQVGTGQVLGIGNSSWAALASLYHSGQHELMRQRLLELSRLAAVLAGVVIIPLTAYNHAFVRLWVGESFYGGDRLTALAGVVGLLAGWWSLWGWVFRGAGILAPVVPTSIASAVVNVLVSVVATAALGWLEGPLIGTVAGFVLVTAWRYPVMFKRYFGLSPTRLITALMPILLAFFATGAAAWWIARRWPPQGWVTLAASMAAAAIGFAVFAILVLLTREERQLWRQRAMMLITGTNS